MSAEWWNPEGKLRTLHHIAPARIQYLRDEIARQVGRNPLLDKPLSGVRILDIGCGGGLVCEPLAKLGATVTGIDPAAANIAIAREHASVSGLVIDYREALVEDLASRGECFDVVCCLEVVEHVPDVRAFLTTVAKTVRPGGLLLASTLNRTLKSYALAIAAAEYMLRWLPAGTHDWNRFVTPAELSDHLMTAGLSTPRFTGLVFDPLGDRWHLARDTGVNYFAAATKPT